eukprot:Hpha_TRINITY_DN16017_c0_g10::TRINITY_DN16017_c0_g10_i1::g.118061::m.118061
MPRLLSGAVLLSLALACAAGDASGDVNVTSVHLVFSHHLDVGLDLPLKLTVGCVGFGTEIVRRYFDEFIPRALRVAKGVREFGGGDRFRYQVHAWIASLYVDCVAWKVQDGCVLNPADIKCPTADEVAKFDAGVRAGDIVINDAPFNINPEAVGDPLLLEGLALIPAALDARYNLTAAKHGTRVWANVDVKGFVRSALPVLKSAGYGALYIGANGGPGLQPVVGGSHAKLFMWRDPVSNVSLPTMYHRGYGGYKTREECFVAPNGVALATHYGSDNLGPPFTAEGVLSVFKTMRGIFPGATVQGSSHQEFAAAALTPETLAALPISTADWGDQWLTGVSTDPYRLAAFRALSRARNKCVREGGCLAESEVLQNFTRFLAKNVEHTQGVQGEDWSPGLAGPLQKWVADKTHWSNEAFASVHNAEHNKFFMGDRSWIEAREFNKLAVGAVPSDHPLAAAARAELEALTPRRPDTSSLIPSPLGAPISCGGMTVAFNSSNGALVKLDFGGGTASGFVSGVNPMFDLTYVTYNQSETWDRREGMTCDKDSCANPEDAVWRPELQNVSYNGTAHSCRVVTRAVFPTALRSKYGAPAEVFVEYTIGGGRLEAALSWYGKKATRLPESFMLGFTPAGGGGEKWWMDILGEWVQPEEVGTGGTNFYNRAVNTGVRYGSSGAGLEINSTDAAMACPVVRGLGILGDATPIGEGNPAVPKDVKVSGVAMSLLQNLMPISGFNQWYPFGVGDYYQKQDEASLFRFAVAPF